MENLAAKEAIRSGKTYLGIELGSTRIKAVLVGDDYVPMASGSHEWENKLVDNIWTYSLEDIWGGIQDCYQDLAKDVKAKYDEELTTFGSIGFSAMMQTFKEIGNMLIGVTLSIQLGAKITLKETVLANQKTKFSGKVLQILICSNMLSLILAAVLNPNS